MVQYSYFTLTQMAKGITQIKEIQYPFFLTTTSPVMHVEPHQICLLVSSVLEPRYFDGPEWTYDTTQIPRTTRFRPRGRFPPADTVRRKVHYPKKSRLSPKN